MKKYLNTMLKGVLMGTADVVPGVSGGTIAFITGIYEELIATIDGLSFQAIKDIKLIGFGGVIRKYNLKFLLSLILGIGIAVVSLSKLISYLLETYPVLVWAFFFGLVVASILYIARQINRWNGTALLAIIIATAISYYITIAEPIGSPDTWWYIIFSGFIAIIAMILPGVSGAFLLLLLGSYKVIIGSISGLVEALSQGDWSLVGKYLTNLMLFALGCIVGLKIFSRILTWLFKNKENTTLALLTGFMIGSLNKLWPWKKVISTRVNSHGEEVPFLEKSILPQYFDGEPKILLVFILALLGFALIFILEKWAAKKQ
ncbi:integral membrane protein [Nonlabens tegetincola]|uniref:Integral membrane protein n=1 Tax=Nonlabens tegetincola TaxID=323273 RepID=A0A090Q5A9_9FLAO|nr:integral membrane protein [Nonlabens tegetincola]